MQILHHHPICPLSRQIRIYLKEFGVEFEMIKEDYWAGSAEFLRLSPGRITPALQLTQDKDSETIVGVYAILEYINDTYTNFFFLPEDAVQRAKIRQYTHWFNEKFYREVSRILINEKIIRLLDRIGAPRSNFIQTAKLNLAHHLTFLSNLLEKNSYIGSNNISIADISAASHISVLDYFGEINWDDCTIIQQWYAIIKSRPAFKPLLTDRIAGFAPSKHYANLDF